MKIVAAVGVSVILLLMTILLVVYSGTYNVAATSSDSQVVRWVLSTTKERSVRNRASTIATPPLSDEAQILNGFRHYQEMCVQCHGAPGISRSELSKGLNPEPPELATKMKKWSPAELYWIIKNGIKMSGMPAWGLSHSDDDLWTVVAFLERLSAISPDEYRAMEEEAGRMFHGHDEPTTGTR
jgi:mono/diheme cytochrome c family protein